MQKWEYKVVELAGPSEERESQLNRLGEQGWELVAIVNAYDWYYLKRLKS
jgi:hypothetical protein